MEDNFRNALIIISAIVIAAIFIHGLWTIRKNKNPYKLKTRKEKIEPVNREFDGKGFDQDGVGQVKVVTTALTGEIENPPADNEIPGKPAPAPSFDEEPLPVDVEEVASPIQAIEPVVADLPDAEPIVEDDVNSASVQETASEQQTLDSSIQIVDEPTVEKSVYQEPVIQAKPSAEVNASRSKARAKKDALKRNQFELNFGDADIESADEPKAVKKQEPLETEVIVLSVVMPEGQLMSGAALLPSLLTLGMKYGDMNIFHRHQDNAGNGKITFSLANMMNPGTFDLDNMENFATQGITLFMTLPNAGDPFEVFEYMLASAKQLGQEFQALVLDDKRSVMTKQTEQHYVSRIREFERKSRIANA